MSHHGPEHYLKEDIKKHLATLHATGQALEPDPPYFFMPVQTGYGKRSIDFLICAKWWLRAPSLHTRGSVRTLSQRATFLGIETKAPGKTPTAIQWACMEAIEAAGGVAFWCFTFDGYWAKMYEHGFVTRERPPEKKLGPPRGRAAMIV